MSPRSHYRVGLIVGALLAGGPLPLPSACAQDENAPAVEATDVSDRAASLPFPPDAREVEFDATFGDIECKSGSSLASLEDFYRRTMKVRGWAEDESQASSDDESAKLAFEVGSAKVVIELDADSDGEVSVSMDCEGLDFAGTSDPAALVAAGVPQPGAYIFLQKLPRPEVVQDPEYGSNACNFRSPLALQAAFDFYLKELKGLGWRESRKPIVTDDRRYTEFKKGAVTVSVNIFEHEDGSRIILEYENPPKEKSGPPLPAVASNRPGKPMGQSSGDEDAVPPTAEKTPVDVSANKGSATVTTGNDKFVFKHVAAFQNKEGGDQKTTVVFCDRPIPMQRLQAMLATKADFRFGDLFEFESPGQLSVELGGYLGFSFNAGGVGIGNSLEASDSDIKVEAGRARGAIKMAEPKEVFDEPFLIAATIDAAVLTPHTTLGGAADRPAPARPSASPDAELLLPEGADNARSEGSKYSKTMQADVDLPLPAVAAFYRQELAAQGWQEEKSATGNTASSANLRFKKSGGTMVVKLAGDGDRTTVNVASLDEAKAKRDGILPEPGKGRLVMVNAHTQDVVVMVGKKSYTLKAGQGADDPKAAWNYSVAPGKYDLTIKFPGKAPQSEKIEIGRDTAWALLALPNGEHLTNQLFGATK